jgi:glycosyltransferase involved in cell wall biosynthesis
VEASAANGEIEPPELSVILPVHNDAEYLVRTIDAYREVLDRMGSEYEIVLVTNACRDRSVAISAELANRYDNIAHVDLELGGWGRAVRAGLAVARGQMICYTNVARTSAPTLALLVGYSRAFPDLVVKASRRSRDSWRRRLGSIIYNMECRLLFDTAIWDVNGTPKVFPRGFDALCRLQRDDDLIDAEFVMLCRQYDYPMVDVPVLQTVRHGGNSTTGYRSAVRMYIGALELWSRRARRRG